MGGMLIQLLSYRVLCYGNRYPKYLVWSFIYMAVIMSEDLVIYSLMAILVVVLLGPLLSKRIEENLEVFFLVMGFLASLVSGSLGLGLLLEALKTPLMIRDVPLGIFQAVLVSGILFEMFRDKLRSVISSGKAIKKAPLIYSILVFILGMGSSVISAIVASVIIAEVARTMEIPRGVRTLLLVIPAYAIGAGAALTPLGEPLSTIAVAKLSGEPYHADFFFLARLLWDYVVAIVAICSILSWYLYRRALRTIEAIIAIATPSRGDGSSRSYREAVVRAIKIYIFVFALVLLGHSFDPVVERYIVHLSPEAMYLFGSVSAALDNATLTAAIVTPEMEILQIKSFLISLLISGGFLIPGNVPNIVIAYINGVGFREWAYKAIPIGLPLFLGSFIALFYLRL
jgi:predicted cation transporter